MMIRDSDSPRIAPWIAKKAAAAFLAGSVMAVSLASCRPLFRPVQPNIVILLTDDQGYGDVGVYGAADIRTPHLDNMASEGLLFTDFYAASPVCTPSRAGLLTGCYPKRIGMGDGVYFPNDRKGMNPGEVTIADLLKRENYSTMAIGKWHLGRPAEVLPTAQGFDHYFGVPYSNDMTPDHFDMVERGGPWPRLPLMKDTDVIDEGTDDYGVDQTKLTRLYTEYSVEFIRNNREQPFFLYLAYNQPHYPNIYGEDFAGVSGRGRYGDAVEEIDWSVGEILKALKENGVDENTLVIFTSDNGPWKFVLNMAPDRYGHWSSWSDGTTGRALPLAGWKSETYEGGQRVPCIMRWPGKIPGGTKTSELVSALDILPTIADMTGIDISQNLPVDGKSIRKILSNPVKGKSPHDYFLYYDSNGLVLRAIRSAAGYKLQMFSERDDTFEVNELFYLPGDIHTDHNLADEFPEIVRELTAAAKTLDKDISENIRPQWSR